ncbi:MAG: hypothetical protein ABSB42_04660 [Tepidisphaeraceae bacterium]
MDEPHKLDYAVPPIKARPSPYAIVSVCVALAVISFQVGIHVWHDLLQSMPEETPFWIVGAGPIVGILLAVRAWCDEDRKQFLTRTGLVLNVLALLSLKLLLPDI